MKISIRRLLKSLFFISILFMIYGCEPVNLIIEGLPPFNSFLQVDQFRLDQEVLVLSALENETAVDVIISPWTGNKEMLKKITGCSLDSRIIYKPEGISRILNFSKDGESFIILYNKIWNGFSILDGVTIIPGEIIKKMENDDKFWVTARLVNSDGQTLEASPGGSFRLKTGAEEWNVMLIGASVPSNNVGENQEIIPADEQGFTADIVLYK